MNYEFPEEDQVHQPQDRQDEEIHIEFVDIYEGEDAELAVAMNCSNG